MSHSSSTRITPRSFDLSGEEYALGPLIGKGATGTVFRGQYTGTAPKGNLVPAQPVALKFVSAAQLYPREVLLQARVQHPNIVAVYDVIPAQHTTSGEWFVCSVLELADVDASQVAGPSIWDCIRKTMEANMRCCVYQPRTLDASAYRRPVQGGEPIVRWIFMQVAAALDFLHRHPLYVSNRDVKASNVLIMAFELGADRISRPSVKLADFGFADVNERATRLGTIGCIAPEVFWKTADTKYDGTKVDVWSAAVMLYELTTGLRPFIEAPAETERPTHNDIRAIMARSRGDHRYHGNVLFSPQRAGGLSPELTDLLRRMFAVDPAQRLSMKEVMQHAWCKKMDYDVTFVADGGGVHSFPCWELCLQQNEAAVKQVHAEYARVQAAGSDPIKDGVLANWSIPHRDFAQVRALLQEMAASHQPPAAAQQPPAQQQQHAHTAMETQTHEHGAPSGRAVERDTGAAQRHDAHAAGHAPDGSWHTPPGLGLEHQSQVVEVGSGAPDSGAAEAMSRSRSDVSTGSAAGGTQIAETVEAVDVA